MLTVLNSQDKLFFSFIKTQSVGQNAIIRIKFLSSLFQLFLSYNLLFFFFRLKKHLHIAVIFCKCCFPKIDQLNKEVIMNQMKNTGIVLSFSIETIVIFLAINSWERKKKEIKRTKSRCNISSSLPASTWSALILPNTLHSSLVFKSIVKFQFQAAFRFAEFPV